MTTLSEGIFEQNAWANDKLIEACLGLTEEQLDLEAPGTYGSVRDTLKHLVGAQGRYIGRLTGELPSDMPSAEEKVGLDKLRALAASTGARLTELASTVKADEVLRLDFQGEKYEVDAGVILVQVINHATEHRSHIRTVLSQHGIDSPELDGWTWAEAANKLKKG